MALANMREAGRITPPACREEKSDGEEDENDQKGDHDQKTSFRQAQPESEIADSFCGAEGL
jgi:hypothetical protein